ncbi:NADH--cytochrome b5 reductase 1 [Hibiscus syriacus]|uniref:cytochrome-b5 reductase n=1 Tax=Hibiscus syriacus TaxID=106335 RepID=A0A6A2WK50_HIBSY|nr:NADH--cytochrome b5 reductase 1 [Hibiscus syriacus]
MDLEFLQSVDVQILVGAAVAVLAIVVGAAYLFSSRKPKGCLDPENFKDFKLVKRQQLSHNVAKFTFELPTPTSVLGLPIGQHISCRGKDSQGEEVIKPYTPTTLDSDVGRFELVIKDVTPFQRDERWCYLAVKGPKGRFRYQPGQVRAFGMIAGGSGITPMFQVARAILENPKDTTNVHLIYANVTYEDILLKVFYCLLFFNLSSTRLNDWSKVANLGQVSSKPTFGQCRGMLGLECNCILDQTLVDLFIWVRQGPDIR